MKCKEKGCRKKVINVIKGDGYTIYHHAARFDHKQGVLTGGLCVVPKGKRDSHLQERRQRERDLLDL